LSYKQTNSQSSDDVEEGEEEEKLSVIDNSGK
jgi:hypothetical protein